MADVAYGLDVIPATKGIELSAQTPDDDIDGAFVDFTAVAPHPIEQLRARIDPLRVRNEELHKTEGGWAQHHRAIV